MRFYYLNNQIGAALPLAILTVMLLTIISGTMTVAINSELKIRTATEERIKARYLAEAGIEHGLFLLADPEINLDENFPISDQLINSIGNYSVDFDQDENIITITTTGITQKQREMTIKVTIDEDGMISNWQEDYGI